MADLKIKKYSAVFLDRDGVINKRIIDGYVTVPAEFIFLPRALEGLKILSDLFNYVFVVTNQQGIGRQLMSAQQLWTVHAFMKSEITTAGGRIDMIYTCPHNASENCRCRKPKNGMFQNAMVDFPDIEPSSSYMIGDTLNDMIFGKTSGLKTILITDKISPEITTIKHADIQCYSLFDAAKHLKKIIVT